MKPIIYIAGPITGIAEYYKPFERAEDEIRAAGMIPLNPCWMPEDLPGDRCITIALSMLAQADGVIFLPGFEHSEGCGIEMSYAAYLRKPYAGIGDMSRLIPVALELKEVLQRGRA